MIARREGVVHAPLLAKNRCKIVQRARPRGGEREARIIFREIWGAMGRARIGRRLGKRRGAHEPLAAFTGLRRFDVFRTALRSICVGLEPRAYSPIRERISPVALAPGDRASNTQ